ncbi:MAG: hypothetical protein NVV62_19080 [Terricaulis sp.]|nr:hypothetical protein [Terricaulis sp.]
MIESAARPNWTQEIADWSLDAAEEAHPSRYYWVRDAISGLENGHKAIVIGRKGTGKTALIRYLSQSTRIPNTQSCVFDLQDFGVFHRNARELSTSEPDTELFAKWQMTILAEIAKLMLHSKNVDGNIKRELAKALTQSPSEMLSGQASVTVAQSAGFSLLGHGASAGQRSETRESTRSLPERAREFCNYLCDYIDGTTYFILIDGIDSNYTSVTDSLGEDYFLAYARALVRAVLSIRKSFAQTNKAKVFPIIAMRSDIYQRIKDADKGKWSDVVVDLRWSQEQLEHLADFRVARMQNPSVKHFESSGAFTKIYKAKSYKRKPIFKHLCDASFNRPRDVVNFVRLSFDHSTWPIANSAMPYLYSKQSAYLRQEVVDEAHVVFPESRAFSALWRTPESQ